MKLQLTPQLWESLVIVGAGLRTAWWVLGLLAMAGCSSGSPHASSGSSGDDAGDAGDAGDPAAGDLPAATQCSVSPQGGCPPAHTCVPAGSSGETSCYGAGSVALGDTCVSVFDCIVGEVCFSDACADVCTADSQCPYAGAKCMQAYDANDMPIPGYMACSSQCNPADPRNQASAMSFGTCGAGLRCDTADMQTGVTYCATPTSGSGVPAGQSCMLGDDCAPGLVCLSSASSSSGTCTPYCLMGQGTCSQGSCQSFATEQYVGSTQVGYCG